MKKKLPLMVGLLEGSLVLLAIYFEPTHVVRGTVWGQAFFDARPTSWWREELSHWQISELNMGRRGKFTFFYRTPTTFERWSRWGKDTYYTFEIMGPSLLHGNAAAVPVLRELQVNAAPPLRDLVHHGLNEAKVQP
jgi:hypothetical protein